MPEPMRVLVEDRQTGRTTQLLRWLSEGESRAAWPSWSRVIIVRDECEAKHLLQHHDAVKTVNQLLRERGGPDLAKVILAYDRDRYAIQRIRLHDVAVAVDNAEEWLHQSFGFVPAVVVLTGARMELDFPPTMVRSINDSTEDR